MATGEQVAAVERRSLLASMAVTAALSVVGVILGWFTGSRMILLDGIYGFIGVLVSWMMLYASSLATEDESREYPYGMHAATPLVIGVQGFILLSTLLYAAAGAIQTIREGGTDITAGWGIAYGVLVTVASMAFWVWIKRQSQHSDLITAEATAWRVAAFRGLGMVLGFTLIVALDGTSWSDVTPYVDPGMVLITCLVFLPPPLRMLRGTVRELLEASPPPSVQQPVLAIIADVSARYDLDPPVVRMTKVGPKLYVEIDVVVAPSVTVAQEYQVRSDLDARLAHLPYAVWLNLEFTPRGQVDGAESPV